jgi:hypothetical protein
MIRDLYAANHQERREQAIQETDNHCSSCKTLLGQVKVSRRHRLWFDYGQLHHPNGDPENPDALVEILCASCHMRAHRLPEKNKGKAARRKTGYEVIRIPVLLERLSSLGLRYWDTETGRVAWQVGDLSGEAADSLDVVLTAFHWLTAEVAYLTDKLEQVQPTV